MVSQLTRAHKFAKVELVTTGSDKLSANRFVLATQVGVGNSLQFAYGCGRLAVAMERDVADASQQALVGELF